LKHLFLPKYPYRYFPAVTFRLLTFFSSNCLIRTEQLRCHRTGCKPFQTASNRVSAYKLQSFSCTAKVFFSSLECLTISKFNPIAAFLRFCPRSLAARTARLVAEKPRAAIRAGQTEEPRLAHPAGAVSGLAVPDLAVPNTVLDGRGSGSAAVVALPAAVPEPGLISLPEP
jgi:hypothetical protein